MPIWKPQTRKGPVLLLENDTSTPPTITLKDGRVISAVKADRAGGVYYSSTEKKYQWVFPNDTLGQNDAVLKVDGKEQKLSNTNMSYRGNELGDLQESSKGAIGSTETGPGGSGPFGGFTPGNVGQYGVAPSFIGQYFPKPTNIEGADYQYIDPIKFGQQFNAFQTSEFTKNSRTAGNLAMDALDAEFAGMASYIPKSAALKRGEVAQDNSFNQGQRTGQLMSTIPDVVGNLKLQASDAAAYARGEVPNSVVDNAMRLGTASEAADIAATSGFGVKSSAARKLSDLMSAKDRLGLAQYGNQLVSSNAAQQADLLLAPTSYSNAGQQINVAPSISGSQLQQSNLSALNAATLIPASTGYTSSIGQSQFISNLNQDTQKYNATNANNFALSLFGYLNSYVNSVAGAYQTDINTQVGMSQQQAAANAASNAASGAQQGDFISSLMSLIGQFSGSFGGKGGTSSTTLSQPQIVGATRV